MKISVFVPSQMGRYSRTSRPVNESRFGMEKSFGSYIKYIKQTTLLLALLLAACQPKVDPTPPPSAGGLDPISLQATADALMLSAQSIAQSAQEAEKRAKATEKAYAAQSTRLAQAITATAEAVNLQSTAQAGQATATAQVLQAQAQATAQQLSLMATATADALALQHTQAQATATAQAVLSRQQAEQANWQRARAAAELSLYLGLTFLFGLLVLALYFLWKLGDRYLDILFKRKLLVESRAGTLLLQPAGVQMGVMVITPNTPALPPYTAAGEEDEFASELPPIRYTVNGEFQGYLPRREAEDPYRKLALKLLREGMKVAGAQSRRLPGWRELGWSAQTWSDAIELLRPHVATEVGRSGGTYLVGGYTLRDLYLAVGERRVSLNSPTPRAAVANVQANEW